ISVVCRIRRRIVAAVGPGAAADEREGFLRQLRRLPWRSRRVWQLRNRDAGQSAGYAAKHLATSKPRVHQEDRRRPLGFDSSDCFHSDFGSGTFCDGRDAALRRHRPRPADGISLSIALLTFRCAAERGAVIAARWPYLEIANCTTTETRCALIAGMFLAFSPSGRYSGGVY